MYANLIELHKLEELLKKARIPYEFIEHRIPEDTQSVPVAVSYQIIYCPEGERVSDVIFGVGTYGFEDGLLEQMGLIPNEPSSNAVQGWLDASTVFDRWRADYSERRGKT